MARWAVFVAIALGILTSAIETAVDYFDELQKTDQLANDILRAAVPSAGEATYQIDRNLAHEVLRGIFSYHFVQSTKIVDDFGTELANLERDHSKEGVHIGRELFGESFKTYQVDLKDPNRTQFTGYLKIVIDQNIAFEEFYHRSILNFVVGVLKNGLLLLVLFFIFYRFIDKPLISLIGAIDRVDPKNPQPIASQQGKANQDNELGKLEAATNRLLRASEQHLKDLTDAQHQLKLNEAKLNAYAKAASDWFWETNSNLEITSISDRFFELSGKRAGGVIGRPLVELSTHREMNGSQQTDLRDIIETRVAFREHAISLKRADGTIVYASISGLPYFSEDGRFLGYRGIGTDQTSLVKSEMERQRLSDDLQHSQKLRVVGQISSGISHDFNNLLAVIMGNLELIKLEGKLSKKARNFLGLAIDATHRGAQLTRRLLAYSRQQQLVPRTLNPGQLLFDLEALLRRSVGENVSMELVVGGGLWRCRADVQELETVLLNLAINARDAMPGGGKLTVEVFNARLDPTYALAEGGVEPGQYVCFALTDNGCGMDKETQDKVFEPYFTTKPVGEGSGLGLAMAYGFAKQSNGHIKIYSEPDRGTTIKLYLPRTSKTAMVELEDVSQLQDLDRLKGIHILIVEDQLEVRQTIRAQLENLGCTITEASNANEAIQRCEQEAQFDILLLDVILPGNRNGGDLSARLQQLVPNAQIVHMSGYTENSVIHNGQVEDPYDLVQKPFSGGELAIRLIAALEKSGRRNVPTEQTT